MPRTLICTYYQSILPSDNIDELVHTGPTVKHYGVDITIGIKSPTLFQSNLKIIQNNNNGLVDIRIVKGALPAPSGVTNIHVLPYLSFEDVGPMQVTYKNKACRKVEIYYVTY